MMQVAEPLDKFVEYGDATSELETYNVPAIGPDDGRHLFSYLGVFLTYITPHDITVLNCVLEILKDVFQSKATTIELILEALKIESGFICLMAIFLLISIITICTVLIWACSSDKDELPNDDQQQNVMTLEDSIDSTFYCRRMLQFLLQFFSLLLIVSIAILFITNELVRSAVTKTPNVVKSSLQDVEHFSRDAHKDILSSIHDGLNTATERIKYDLENVDKLLGDPIQKDIESDSGLKITLESIFGICSANYEIIHRVQLLQDALGKAVLISKEAAQRIEEFQIQLSILQRQCSSRDRPLCDTLRLRSFDDNGILNTLTRLQSDPNLLRMLNLGEYHMNNNHINISMELKVVQKKLQDYPDQVKMDLTKSAENIVQHLAEMQSKIQASTYHFTSVMNNMFAQLEKTHKRVEPLMKRLISTGEFLWYISLSVGLAIVGVSLTLSAGLLFGIIHEERAAKITFILGAILIAIASLGLALFAIAILLVGSHAEVFLCRPLYGAPHFHLLGKLFDKPGWVYENDTNNGIINEFLYANDNEEIKPLNISLGTVINQCEQNDATFSVFQFERIINIPEILDVHEFSKLDEEIEKIFVSGATFTSLTDTLQGILSYMFTNSEINFALYRSDLSRPTPEKDLSTFIDQMQRVSVQIQEASTSSRMSTLGNRARRLQTNVLQPLERLRSEIQFELTALQLQKEPWVEMVNQSLVHLKATQYFINQDSADICFNKTLMFKQRLREHIALNKRETLRQLLNRVAPCRALFNIFDTNRHLFCHHIIDPLNGLWFSAFACLLLWAILTPIALGLANVYKQMNSSRGFRRSNSHQAPTESLIISEQSNWGSRQPLNRQSVRSSRSEITDFTFDEDQIDSTTTPLTGGPSMIEQRSILVRRDVTFSE